MVGLQPYQPLPQSGHCSRGIEPCHFLECVFMQLSPVSALACVAWFCHQSIFYIYSSFGLRMPENTFPRIFIINVSGAECTLELPTVRNSNLFPLSSKEFPILHASQDVFLPAAWRFTEQRRLKANQTYNKWQKCWDTSQRNSIFENLGNITLARGRSPILTRACAVLL